MLKLFYFITTTIATVLLCAIHRRRRQKAAMGFPGYAREEYDDGQFDPESGWHL